MQFVVFFFDLYVKSTLEVQWNVYVPCCRYIFLATYANNMKYTYNGIFSQGHVSNVKCMYTSACGDIVDCTEFIWGIDTDIVVLSVHMN